VVYLEGVDRAPTRSVGRLVAATLSCLLCVAAFSLCNAGSASASCSGLSCLPTTGYTAELVFECGFLRSTETCWANGTKTGPAVVHTYGFGSASYSGEGTALVYILTHEVYEIGFGMISNGNLARACANEDCSDQDAIGLSLEIGSRTNHTISGHWEA